MSLSNPFTMKPFVVRLQERLEHGQRKHGVAAMVSPWVWTVDQLSDECADLATWSWVLHHRSILYPNAAEVRITIARWVHSSWALTRACVHLIAELDELKLVQRPAADVGAALADRRWITDALTSEDRLDPVRALHTRKLVAAYVRRCVQRSELGAQLYGDDSFGHPGGWLVDQLADDLCGLAGWLHVLRAQTLNAERPPLGGHLQACRVLYDQLPGLRALCAVGEAGVGQVSSFDVPSPESVGPWVEHVLSSTPLLSVVARSATTGGVR